MIDDNVELFWVTFDLSVATLSINTLWHTLTDWSQFVFSYQIQGCESSEFNMISDFFALHKTPFQTVKCNLNALKSTFSGFSDRLFQTFSHRNSHTAADYFLTFFCLLSPCLKFELRSMRDLNHWPAQGVPARHKVLHWTSAPWTRLRYPWCTSLLWCRTPCHPSQSTTSGDRSIEKHGCYTCPRLCSSNYKHSS